MANYALGICELCREAITLEEIREGISWERQEPTWFMGYCLFEAEEECRVAHRRCWKGLKEWERRNIRKAADKAPKSLGQSV